MLMTKSFNILAISLNIQLVLWFNKKLFSNLYLAKFSLYEIFWFHFALVSFHYNLEVSLNIYN